MRPRIKPPRSRSAAAIGRKLQKWRESQDLTQEQVARKLRVSDATISRIEMGTANLTWEWFQKVARLIGMAPADLARATQRKTA